MSTEGADEVYLQAQDPPEDSQILRNNKLAKKEAQKPGQHYAMGWEKREMYCQYLGLLQ